MSRLFIFFLLLFFSLDVHASFVSNFLNEVESGLSYSEHHSSSRSYYSMGSMSVRVNRKSVNPISISPPSINIGCNGIDVIGGGFAFAKGGEIVELFKNVSKQAPMVAVNLAMKNLCTACAETVSEIMDYVQELNNFQLDSCRIAEGAVQVIHDITTDGGVKAMEKAKARIAQDGLLGGKFGLFNKAVDDSKKPETTNKEIQQLKFSGKDYLINGGSLLEYIYKDWDKLNRSGITSSSFQFPNKVNINRVRALYGDVIKKGDVYATVASCGKDFDALVDNTTIRKFEANGATDCEASNESIKSDVGALIDEIINSYIDGTNVSDKAINFLDILGNTNAGHILVKYAKAGDKEYLRSISPLLKAIASYEITKLYYSVLYLELVPVLNILTLEASMNADSFGPIFIATSRMWADNITKNYNKYNNGYIKEATPLYDSLKFYEYIKNSVPDANTIVSTIADSNGGQ